MPTPDAGVGAIIATRAARRIAESALPGAPVVPDRAARLRATSRRRVTADVLRTLAATSGRLADRLDPRCA
jgi:hypothetical protein